MNFRCKCDNCKAEQEVNPVEIKTDEKAIKELTNLNTLKESKESYIPIDHHSKLTSFVKIGLCLQGISKESYNRTQDNLIALKNMGEIRVEMKNLVKKKKYWICKLCKFRNNIGFDEKGD